MTGIRTLSKRTGISPRSIRTCLDRLMSTHEIILEATHLYTLITLCNYETYQDSDSSTDTAPTQHRHSTDTQIDTQIDTAIDTQNDTPVSVPETQQQRSIHGVTNMRIDTVTDTDTDTQIDKPQKQKLQKNDTQLRSKENKKERKQKNSVYDVAVHDSFKRCLEFFPEELWPDTEARKEKWLDTIDKLHRIDGVTFEQIENVVRYTREDEFWSHHFLAITKLRNVNKDGVKYIKVFSQHIRKKRDGKQSRLTEVTNSIRQSDPGL